MTSRSGAGTTAIIAWQGERQETVPLVAPKVRPLWTAPRWLGRRHRLFPSLAKKFRQGRRPGRAQLLERNLELLLDHQRGAAGGAEQGQRDLLLGDERLE